MDKKLGRLFKTFKKTHNNNEEIYDVYEKGIKITHISDGNKKLTKIEDEVETNTHWKELSNIKRIDVEIPHSFNSSSGEVVLNLGIEYYSVLYNEKDISEKEVNSLIDNCATNLEEISDERVMVISTHMADRFKKIMKNT